jgi:hypothetical protein
VVVPLARWRYAAGWTRCGAAELTYLNVVLDFDMREVAVSSHQGSCLGCGICVSEVNMRLRWPNRLHVSTPRACILHIASGMAIA